MPKTTMTTPKNSFYLYVKRQFNTNKLAVYSMYIAIILGFIAIFADFIANDKPLIAKYKGEWYFPIFKDYAVNCGLSQWQPQFNNIKWQKTNFDFAVFPLIPYTPQYLDEDNDKYKSPLGPQNVPSYRFRHWLGTDKLGRDVMSGMIHGARIAFLVGIVSMSLSAIIGVVLGAFAGFFGDDRFKISLIRLILNCLAIFAGFFYAFYARSYQLSDAISNSISQALVQIIIMLLIFTLIIVAANLLATLFEKLNPLNQKSVAVPLDLIVTRLIEIVVSIPRLILIMSIIAIVKPSIFIVMVIIGLTSWTGIARFIRAELLKIRNLEYIEAAESLGYSNLRIMIKHAVPNALSPVFIAIAFGIASAVLTESTLSFLGIGVSPETVTWGSLLKAARSATSAWWLAIFPGVAIFITVTVFNLIGEGLTDALDPRLKE